MELILSFILALVITMIMVGPTIVLAKKYSLTDDPKKRPHPAHLNSKIVPRAGGLAIFFGIVISILIFIPLQQFVIGILTSLSLLLIMGLLDDRLHDFNPYTRLVLQFTAAVIVVLSGVGISFVTNLDGGILRLDQIIIPIQVLGITHNIVLIADVFAVIWIVWIMNVINWSKGVDGQMPGIIFVAAITISMLAMKQYLQGDINQLMIAELGLITAGSAAGFLYFNWYPAKIFPGFSGSTILGFMIATISILTSAKLATALLVLLIPTVDFLYTFFRRILAGKSPVFADREHLHHQLLNLGWSHRQISLFYLVSGGLLGAAATLLSSQAKIFTVVSLSILLLGFLIWLRLFLQSRKESDES